MTSGRMSPKVILAIICLLGFCLTAVAAEKPLYINKARSPLAPAPTPDPNWQLKAQMGVTGPDFDINGKVGPHKIPMPTKQLPASSLLAEDFEVSVPPAGWGLTSTHGDTMTWYQASLSPFSGSYYADVKYDEALVPQDEWLMTPILDFDGATSDLKVQFAMEMSYYWGVSPYDNYNLELWISTDDGTTFPTKLWDESALGVFTNWAWYEITVDLSAYVGEKDVVLAWRYVGTDGAEAGIDLVSVNDDPPPTGRCCYGDQFTPSCDDVSELACEGLGGTWSADLTCADDCPIPPANDNWADAEKIDDVTDLPFSTAMATFDGWGTCLTSPNIWYCYTAPCDGIATVSLCGSSYDTKLAVYDGCQENAAQIACNDDACSLQSELVVNIVSGNEYLIEVGGYGSNAGDGILNVTSTCGGGIENDNWDNATKIDDVTDLAFSTVGATFDGWGTCMTTPNIWYCYTAPCDGFATFSLCGSSFDTKIAVYDGCGENAPQLACNDDYCGLQSQTILSVTAGNEYLIEVGGYSGVGSGVLSVSTACGGEGPENDNCSDANIVTSFPATITGDNTFSTNDCDDLAPATEAWEAFTITEKMDVTIDYCGTSPAFELVYVILKPDCPCTATSIFADNTDWDLCGDGNVTMHFLGLEPGTYYLPVLAFTPDYPDYYYQGPYTIHIDGTPWVPHYCDATGGCDEYIANVTTADINNSSACDGYADFTGQIANMQYGVGYPITITLGTSYSSDYGAVWVDWNQDLDFDDAGEAITLDVNYGNGPYTGTITPPAGATAGNTRMRVRLNYAATPPSCGSTTYGEVEDYTINVGGEQSVLTIDPTAVDFGTVASGSTGGSTLTLGAEGSAPINYSIAVSYDKAASVGGGQSDQTLKKSPFQGEGFVPAAEKGANSLLFEGFESGVMPPSGWTTIVNNVYSWEIDTYAPYEGVYNGTVLYDDTYSGDQDEWLISPAIDFAGQKYVLDFWWNGSYYWSVDPYDNCDLSVWISLDGGATWLLELFNENNYGVFTNWEWNNSVIDLSPFKDESNVKLAFVYTGYDGAQFSVDAISIDPAPLSWLSVAPNSGSIAGGETVPVSVNYDATDLEDGDYSASLTITHTGAPSKTTSVVPVTMTVGQAQLTNIDPNPVLALYAYTVNPLTGTMYMRHDDMPVGYEPSDIDGSSMMINGSLAPMSEQMNGDVMEMTFDVGDFVRTYPLLWDVQDGTYSIAGTFSSDSSPFSIDYPVTLIGHKSGDANLDGMVNVGDAVFVVQYIFKGGDTPLVRQTADANCDGVINIGDAVHVVNYIFKNGANPCHVGE